MTLLDNAVEYFAAFFPLYKDEVTILSYPGYHREEQSDVAISASD